MLTLYSPVELRNEHMRTTARFSVGAGDSRAFCMTHQQSFTERQPSKNPYDVLEDTEEYWTSFSSRCPDVGDYTEEVKRSLITLKALIYLPTGGIVAAPTTSLPERIGGQRNWDYRYCWLRDSSLTLMAFMELGFYEEAKAWRDWLMRAAAGDPAQIQIMYGVTGERQLVEWEAFWLEGFAGSKPVRIGNAAAEQFQLDVYGEVAETMTLAVKGGIGFDKRALAVSGAILPFLEEAWRKPDEGIWEMRGGSRHFVHSKVMAWVAFDRVANRDAPSDAPEDRKRWREIADAIHADVCTHGFDEELGAFVQSYGSKTVDASLLQIPLVGFLSCHDPRVVGTVRAIESRLMKDGFVLRYDASDIDDGVSREAEGVFLMCTFWLI